MAKTPPPPKRKAKAVPPPPEQIKNNLGENLTTLNFKVPKQFKKEFKQFAFDKDITMRELLERIFEAYK